VKLRSGQVVCGVRTRVCAHMCTCVHCLDFSVCSLLCQLARKQCKTSFLELVPIYNVGATGA
jgi:hypothetical protein